MSRSSDGAPHRLRPAAHLIALAGLAALIVSLSIFKVSNNDIWIHLKTGEIILETWRFPGKDPYSFTAPSADYIAHEWLSAVIFHLVYRAGGVNGLIVFKTVVFAAVCAALYRTCVVLGVREWLIYPVMTATLFIAADRFVERPHIFTFLFLALYLLCYFQYRERGRRRAWLCAVPLLHVAWANMHGAHLQGVALLATIACAEIAAWLRARQFGLARADALPARDLAIVTGLPVLCLLAALVNPYGYRLLAHAHEVLTQDALMRHIFEWLPPVHPTFNFKVTFPYYVAWTTILFGSFFAVRGHDELRGRARAAAVAAHWLLALLLAVFASEFAAAYRSSRYEAPVALVRHEWFWYGAAAVFVAANAHRLQFHHAGIVAAFFAFSLRHNRAVTDAVIVTMPTLAHNLDAALTRCAARARPAPAWSGPALVAAMGAAMLGLAAHTHFNGYYLSFTPPIKRDAGPGIVNNLPFAAVDYLESNGITGNAYASYAAAALLIHRLWPRVKVAMDSRADIYGEDLFLEYLGVQRDPGRLPEYLAKWPVDFFLLTYPDDNADVLSRYLDASRDWSMVYFDDLSLLYVKNSPQRAALVARDRFALIKPARGVDVAMSRASAPAWLAEAERAAAAAPGSTKALYFKFRALTALGRLDDAESAVREILRMKPEAFVAWSDLAVVHMLKGEPDRAREAAERCARLQPGNTVCEAYRKHPAGNY